MKTAIDFFLGKRPAGGPFRLVITDDGRWKTQREYKLHLVLTTEDGRVIIYDGRCTATEIQAAVTAAASD